MCIDNYMYSLLIYAFISLYLYVLPALHIHCVWKAGLRSFFSSLDL